MGEEACPNPNGCIYCDEFGCPRIEDPTPAIRAAFWAAVNWSHGRLSYGVEEVEREINAYIALMNKAGELGETRPPCPECGSQFGHFRSCPAVD